MSKRTEGQTQLADTTAQKMMRFHYDSGILSALKWVLFSFMLGARDLLMVYTLSKPIKEIVDDACLHMNGNIRSRNNFKALVYRTFSTSLEQLLIAGGFGESIAHELMNMPNVVIAGGAPLQILQPGRRVEDSEGRLVAYEQFKTGDVDVFVSNLSKVTLKHLNHHFAR